MTDHLNRRRFLQQSAATGAAAAVLSTTALQAANAAQRKVVVGVMGLSRGAALAELFATQPDSEVKYVCDVDAQRAQACAKKVEQRTGTAPEAITDFRRILDDQVVDALVCAAPNHWHAPATILGCSAGKHVYVEKPCSHNPQEGEWMVQAARKHKRAVQMGTQRRSSPSIIEAIQQLHEGIIGRVYCARSYYNNARGSIGQGRPAAPPQHLDYELWQGPAPRRPYMDNVVHYNWHWFWHWGNGELGNNGVHAIDICRWGLQVDYPTRVTSSGGRYVYDDDQQTPDTHVVAFEFEGEKAITWQGLSCNRHHEVFVTFFGENGTLEIDGGGEYRIYDRGDKLVKDSGGVLGEPEHAANFLAAIRNDQPLSLSAEIEEGHKSTLLCHLGNIAHRTGRVIGCDPSNGHILNDSEAAALWQREYAEGWEPKV